MVLIFSKSYGKMARPKLRVVQSHLPRLQRGRCRPRIVEISGELVAARILPSVVYIIQLDSGVVQKIVKFPTEVICISSIESTLNFLIGCVTGEIFLLETHNDSFGRELTEQYGHNTQVESSQAFRKKGKRKSSSRRPKISSTENNENNSQQQQHSEDSNNLFEDLGMDGLNGNMPGSRKLTTKTVRMEIYKNPPIQSHRGLKLLLSISEQFFMALGMIESASIYSFGLNQERIHAMEKLDGSIPICAVRLAANSIMPALRDVLINKEDAIQCNKSTCDIIIVVADSAGCVKSLYCSEALNLGKVYLLTQTCLEVSNLCEIKSSNSNKVEDILIICCDGSLYSLVQQTFAFSGTKLPAPVEAALCIGTSLFHLSKGHLYTSGLITDEAIATVGFEEDKGEEQSKATPCDVDEDETQTQELASIFGPTNLKEAEIGAEKRKVGYCPRIFSRRVPLNAAVAAFTGSESGVRDRCSPPFLTVLTWTGKVLQVLGTADSDSIDTPVGEGEYPQDTKNTKMMLQRLSKLWEEHQVAEARSKELVLELKQLRTALDAVHTLKESFPPEANSQTKVISPTKSEGKSTVSSGDCGLPLEFALEVTPGRHTAAAYVLELKGMLKAHSPGEVDLCRWHLLLQIIFEDPLHINGKRVETVSHAMPDGLGVFGRFELYKTLQVPTLSPIHIDATLVYPFQYLRNSSESNNFQEQIISRSQSEHGHFSGNPVSSDLEGSDQSLWKIQGPPGVSAMKGCDAHFGNGFLNNSEHGPFALTKSGMQPGKGVTVHLGTWMSDVLDWSSPAPSLPISAPEMRHHAQDLPVFHRPEDSLNRMLNTHQDGKNHSDARCEARGAFACSLRVHFSNLCGAHGEATQGNGNKGTQGRQQDPAQKLTPLELLLGPQSQALKFHWSESRNAAAGYVCGELFSINTQSLLRANQHQHTSTAPKQLPQRTKDCTATVQILASTDNMLLKVRQAIFARMKTSLLTQDQVPASEQRNSILLGNRHDLEAVHGHLHSLKLELDGLIFEYQQLLAEKEKSAELGIPTSSSLMQRVQKLEKGTKEKVGSLMNAVDKVPFNL